MDDNDDLIATFGHLVLAGLAGKALGTASIPSFTHPGMHANYVLYGLTGGLFCISKSSGLDVMAIHAISKQAVEYIALPSLMADLYHDQKYLCAAHVASGLIPFIVAITGNDNTQLSNFVISVNIISLCYYAMKNSMEFAWYTAGCGLVTYFGLSYAKALFPIGLAVTEYCAYKLYDGTFGKSFTKKERKEIERKKKAAEDQRRKASREAWKKSKPK